MKLIRLCIQSVAELQSEVKRLKEELLYASSLLKQQAVSTASPAPAGIRSQGIIDEDELGGTTREAMRELAGPLEVRIDNLQRLIARTLLFQEKEARLREDNDVLMKKVEALEAFAQSKEQSLQAASAALKLKEEETQRISSSSATAAQSMQQPTSFLKKPTPISNGSKEDLLSLPSKIPRLVKKEGGGQLPTLAGVTTRMAASPAQFEEEGGSSSSKDVMWRKASSLQTELLTKEVLQLKEQLKQHPEALRLTAENLDLKKELDDYKYLFANEMGNYNRQYLFLQESHRLLCRELEDLLRDRDTFLAILSGEKEKGAVGEAPNHEREEHDGIFIRSFFSLSYPPLTRS